MTEAAPSESEAPAFFEEHGWIVLRGVLDGALLDEVVGAFDRTMSPWLATAPAPPGERQIWQLPGVGRHLPALLAHFRGELGARVAALLGARRLQLLQDTLIYKPARLGSAVELHQDTTYTGFLDPPRSASVRLSLSGEARADGCLWVVDGSHRWGVQGGYAAFTDRLQEVSRDGLPEELRERIDAARRPVELGPGDVSVHGGLVFHGSFETTGESARKTIVTHVFDGACRLMPERVPESARAYFETDDDGHLLPESFPILYDDGGAA